MKLSRPTPPAEAPRQAAASPQYSTTLPWHDSQLAHIEREGITLGVVAYRKLDGSLVYRLPGYGIGRGPDARRLGAFKRSTLEAKGFTVRDPKSVRA